jgi:hypothetical protein
MQFYIAEFLSCVYPVYASLGVYSRKGGDAEINHWLKYWTIRSFLVIIEFLCEILLEYVPLWQELRCVMYFLLIFKAEWVYHILVEPFLLRGESHIDDLAENAQRGVKNTLTYMGDKTAAFAKDRVKELIDHSTRSESVARERIPNLTDDSFEGEADFIRDDKSEE